MKKLITTLSNIWKIEDLRKRIILTLGIILIYRLGSFIMLPGIDPVIFEGLKSGGGGGRGIMDLLDMFSGGAFGNASIFALGIMPYISASIVIQLLGVAVPYFQKLQKEGESGRKKISQMTRFLTVLILLFQAPGYLATQVPAGSIITPGFWGFTVPAILLLCAGSMFVMWLGERITDKGIGNGISLIIMIGIIARLPRSFLVEFQDTSIIIFIVELLILFLVFIISILLVQGTRRIPIQYAKRIVGRKQYGGTRNYLPLKVNASGVMPIIFAQALMMIPLTFGMGSSDSFGGFLSAITDIYGFWYNFIFAIMIILFTYFYTAITVQPTQIAEEMKRNGGFVPGVKPGKRTAEFIDTVMSRITLPGSIFLAFVAILPAFGVIAGIDNQFAQFYGGTSLLIMVGVVLDTLQQIESHLLMRHYDGLMKSGRIKGKGNMPVGSGM